MSMNAVLDATLAPPGHEAEQNTKEDGIHGSGALSKPGDSS